MAAGPSLGEAVLHLIGDESKLIDTTKGAKSKVEGILGTVGSGLKAAGVGIAATGAAIGAVGGAVYGMAEKAASRADDLMVMAAKTGISVEQLQKLQYAAELVDVPLETMSGSMAKFTNVIGQAAEGNDTAVGQFEALGVSITDQAGELRPVYDIWLDTLDALGQIPNETERSILAQDMLGRSYTEVKPLIQAGKDQLIAYGEEAVKAGAVIGESQVQAAGQLDDSIQRVKGTLSGLVFGLGAQLAPGVESFVSSAGGYLQQFAGIVNNSGMSTEQKIGAASDLVQTIAQNFAAKLPELANTGIGILKSVVTGIVKAIPQLLPAIVEVIMSIVQFLITMMPILADAAVKIIIALAQGISQSLPTLIPAIVEMLLSIVQVIIENLPTLILAGVQILIGLIQGLVVAIPKLVEMIPTLISALVEGIIQALPMLIPAAIQLIVALAQALIQAIPALLTAVPRIIMAIVTGLTNGIGSMVGVGGQLMAGFWSGISSWFGRIATGVGDFINNIVSGIKNALGIHSPSAVGFSIGANFGGSIPAGMEAGLATATEISNRAAGSLALNTAAAIQSPVSNTRNISFVINNPIGETTDDSMSRGLKRLQFLGAM